MFTCGHNTSLLHFYMFFIIIYLSVYFFDISFFNSCINQFGVVIPQNNSKNPENWVFFTVNSVWKDARLNSTASRPVHMRLICYTVLLKLTNHGIMHYLCSADLSKSFSQLIVPIIIFSQNFCNRFWPVDKWGFTPYCLFRDSLNKHLLP